MSVGQAYANPFPGLRSFTPEDAPLFFGRDAQIQDLRNKLTQSRFLAVVGSSGSGKSSLVSAGLVPSLEQIPLSNVRFRDWLVVSFSPGTSPIQNFVLALQSAQGRPFDTRAVSDALTRGDQTAVLHTLTEEAGRNLLIVIDQFEEVFRYSDSSDEDDQVANASFIDLVLKLSRSSLPIYVVLTMRSDYLDSCADFEELTESINKGSYLLPRMNQEQIRQVIVRPIQSAGAEITDQLTERLLDEIGENHSQLPILQHVLMRTWLHWQNDSDDDRPIDVPDYEAVGTLQGAISVHAEEVFSSLPDEQSRAVAERLFKSLIFLGPGSVSLVRPTSLADIQKISGVGQSDLIDVLDRFRDPGIAFVLPAAGQPLDSNAVIDIAHEHIVTLWDRLQTWVKEETDSVKLYQRLSLEAQLYMEGRTGLWTNPELQIGLKWLQDNRPTPDWAERYDPFFERSINYLEYSRSQFEFDQQTKADKEKRDLQRNRYFALALSVGSLFSLLFLVVSIVLSTQAKQSQIDVARKKVEVDSLSYQADLQAREAITQQKIAEQQEIIATQQKELTDEQKQIAVSERNNAIRSQQEAIRAQQNAERSQQDAEKQRFIALTQRDSAKFERDNARLSQRLAETEKSRAIEARKAEEKARREAEIQRGKAVARSLAIQSYQMPKDNKEDELPAILALQAYQLNLKNEGQKANPDVFSALLKASESQQILGQHDDVVRAIAVQPAVNNRLFSCSDDGTIRLWNPNNPDKSSESYAKPRRNPKESFRSLALPAKGNSLYGGGEEGTLCRWEISQPQVAPLALKAHEGPIRTLLITPDNRRMISMGADGHIRTWNVTNGKLDSLQRTPESYKLFCAQITPDSTHLLCGSVDQKILLFDLKDLTRSPRVYVSKGLGKQVTALAFSQDGSVLITGNSAGLLYAWSFINNRILGNGNALAGRHTSEVNSIVFSPDGKTIATSSYDRSVLVWNYDLIYTQQQPIRLTDFRNWVMEAAFTSDGKRLLACGADKTIRVWSVDPADLYNQVLQKVTRRKLTQDEWNKYVGKEIAYDNVTP